ncbi:glycosyltransferase family 2 protein [Gammaproteobacteria bacterium]|nr:glycosyltransferase family 2 protein [Gammaproteobacteria bacterium]
MPNYPDQKLLTICIPTFNRAERVTMLIQELYDFNLNDRINFLIIDDGSSDDTFQKISGFSNYDNISIYKNEINLGRSKTILKYFNLCETEFLIELADDDMLYKDGILESLKLLMSINLELKPDFICTKWIDDNGLDYPGRGCESLQEISLSKVRMKANHSTGCIFRASIIKNAESTILQRLENNCPAAFLYPQVIIILIAKMNGAKLYDSPILMGGYHQDGALLSNLKDPHGNHYLSVGSVFAQHLGFQDLYEEILARFPGSLYTKELNLIQTAHDLSLYSSIEDVISYQSEKALYNMRLGSTRIFFNPIRAIKYFFTLLYLKLKIRLQ